MRPLLLSFLTAAALPVVAGSMTRPAPSPEAARGRAFAEAHCAGCHAVERNANSPNPEAPPWEDVASRPGASEQTLRQFLAESHNYPEAMRFEVSDSAVRDLAAWMITLRRETYKPAP